MKARVILKPEPGFRHFGTDGSRTIELMPSFTELRWWGCYTSGRGRSRIAYRDSLSAGWLSDAFESEGFDLRSLTWSETKMQRWPYNPFFPKVYTAERCSNVYFALSSRTGLIKIGVSGNHVFRLKGLSVQLDTSFTLLGLIEGLRNTEQYIHELLQEHNVEGEWFNDCQTVRDFIAENTYAP